MVYGTEPNRAVVRSYGEIHVRLAVLRHHEAGTTSPHRANTGTSWSLLGRRLGVSLP